MVELEPIAEEDAALEALGHQGGDLESHGLVRVSQDLTRYDAQRLKRLIERHRHYTNSEVARRILADWAAYLPRFVKVMPVDYRRALEQLQSSQRRPPQPARPIKGVAEHG
jgi:glutamate synthase (NADPH/NADH) large chain